MTFIGNFAAFRQSIPLCLSPLDTAYEWLAEQRAQRDETYTNLDWIDVSAVSGFQEPDPGEGEVMPLYPLGAAYLPSNSTHLLNNVEPRNIRMALVRAKQEILSRGRDVCRCVCGLTVCRRCVPRI